MYSKDALNWISFKLIRVPKKHHSSSDIKFSRWQKAYRSLSQSVCNHIFLYRAQLIGSLPAASLANELADQTWSAFAIEVCRALSDTLHLPQLHLYRCGIMYAIFIQQQHVLLAHSSVSQ